ncbi:hypothetical protein BH24ACT13_BH24ACT13_08400 [soil metagenome]|jgi:predicted nucleotidyltransferase
MTAADVIARRQAERQDLLARARLYIEQVAAGLPLRAAVVHGSVARGDFNLWSDVDVLLVVDDLPNALLDRLDLLPPRPPGIEAIAWTPGEWRRQLVRADPIAVGAAGTGVWLYGGLEVLQEE